MAVGYCFPCTKTVNAMRDFNVILVLLRAPHAMASPKILHVLKTGPRVKGSICSACIKSLKGRCHVGDDIIILYK